MEDAIPDDADCPSPVKFTYSKKGKQETIQLPDNNIVYKDAPLNKSQIKFLQHLIFQGYDRSIAYEDLKVEAYSHNGPRKAYLIQTRTTNSTNKFLYTYIITNTSLPKGSYRKSCNLDSCSLKDNTLTCYECFVPLQGYVKMSTPYYSGTVSDIDGALKIDNNSGPCDNPWGSYKKSCENCAYDCKTLHCQNCFNSKSRRVESLLIKPDGQGVSMCKDRGLVNGPC